MSSYIHWDNMTWPNTWDYDLGWRLIHHPETVTDANKLVAASYIGAYISLVNMTQKERNKICKKIKELSK